MNKNRYIETVGNVYDSEGADSSSDNEEKDDETSPSRLVSSQKLKQKSAIPRLKSLTAPEPLFRFNDVLDEESLEVKTITGASLPHYCHPGKEVVGQNLHDPVLSRLILLLAFIRIFT